MQEVIIIRHGEAEHLLKGIVGGWTDTDLTEAGKEQARKTGIKLKRLLGGKSINYYCSDLQRARKTAEIISEEIKVKPIIVPSFHGKDFC